MRRMKMQLSLLLVLTLMLGVLSGCAGADGDVAMSFGGVELHETDYAFLMSYTKAVFASDAANYGITDLSAFFDQVSSDGVTFADMLTDQVNQDAKRMLIVEKLCKDANLTVEDSDSYDKMLTAFEELEANYGGYDAFVIKMAKLGFSREAVQRYLYYDLLLELLRDYRYGKNGVARIPEEDVKKEFNTSYVKAESYLFPFVVSYGSGYTSFLYDFASEYEQDEVDTFFTEQFRCISQLQFKSQAAAEEAYQKIHSGEAKPEDFYDDKNLKTHNENLFVSPYRISDSLQELLDGAKAGQWVLSDEEDGYYYVLAWSEFTLDDMDEDAEEEVRAALVERDAHAFYEENYVTVRHILYRDEEKAKAAYEEVKENPDSFADHEKETSDSGVQYSFTEGSMVQEFQDAAFEMEVGEIRLVKTAYGWHLMLRTELDLKDFDAEDAVGAMSRKKMRTLAEEQFASMKEQTNPTFEEPAKDALYSYSEPTLLSLAKTDETLAAALKEAKVGELVSVETQYGVFIMRRVEVTDEDLKSAYDTVESSLIDTAFQEYIDSYLDSVVVKQSVVSRFDIRTVKAFEIDYTME